MPGEKEKKESGEESRSETRGPQLIPEPDSLPDTASASRCQISPPDWSMTPTPCSSESGGNDTCSPLPGSIPRQVSKSTSSAGLHLPRLRPELRRAPGRAALALGSFAQALPASLLHRKWAPRRMSWPKGRACHSMASVSAEEAGLTDVTRCSLTCPPFLEDSRRFLTMSLSSWAFSEGGRTAFRFSLGERNSKPAGLSLGDCSHMPRFPGNGQLTWSDK